MFNHPWIDERRCNHLSRLRQKLQCVLSYRVRTASISKFAAFWNCESSIQVAREFQSSQRSLHSENVPYEQGREQSLARRGPCNTEESAKDNLEKGKRGKTKGEEGAREDLAIRLIPFRISRSIFLVPCEGSTMVPIRFSSDAMRNTIQAYLSIRFAFLCRIGAGANIFIARRETFVEGEHARVTKSRRNKEPWVCECVRMCMCMRVYV